MVRSKPKKTAENVSKLTICALTVIILAFAFIIAFAFNDGSDCESVKYWSLSEIDPLSLVNLKIVLNVLGWKEVDNMEDADWLWFHDYPFTQFSAEMKKLKAHQRVNHFPGSGWITSKALMSRSVISNHIPKAFYPIHDAEIMKQYFRAHPEKKFVQKDLSNRRVKVITTSDIDMNANFFIQEFIENPLLLDGYHFDFGIFVVVTSIDPLRLYIYDGQMVMRFCTEKYHPFDVENVEKYVIQDPFQYGDTLSIIGKHVNVTKFTMRGAFAAALTNEGHDPEKIFKQVEDIIVDVYTQQEKRLIETVSINKVLVISIKKTYFFVLQLKNFSSKNNFFELVRFDFIIDDNLKVHLMEVNMSPSTKFLDRQKILYNVLNLVGRCIL